MKTILLFFPLALFSLSIFFSCKKDNSILPTIDVPVVSTSEITSIAQVTAVSGGNVTDQPGAAIISQGVCWSSLHTPTIADSLTNDGKAIGIFISNVNKLKLNHTYKLRAYATNSGGTGYGQELTFTTLSVGKIVFNPSSTYGSVTDIDGNIYKTIQIGTQFWMAENLKTTRYRNGDLIGTTVPADKELFLDPPPKYQWSYNGDETNVSVYGRLYTWYAATDGRNVCPDGWHLPSESDWNTLSSFLGGADIAGSKLKETGTTHWISPNSEATNQSGFSGVPGGIRQFDGKFIYVQYMGRYWSSGSKESWGWMRNLDVINNNLYTDSDNKEKGISVRCISDN